MKKETGTKVLLVDKRYKVIFNATLVKEVSYKDENILLVEFGDGIVEIASAEKWEVIPISQSLYDKVGEIWDSIGEDEEVRLEDVTHLL